MKNLVEKKADRTTGCQVTDDTKEYWDIEDRLYEQYKELKMEGRLKDIAEGD